MFHRRHFIENIVTLYGLQACNYVLPLLTIPYLARVLGPKGWGALATAQSIGVYISLAIEYGFELSASRSIAHVTDDRAKIADVAAGVVGCKAIASIVVFALAVVATVVIGKRSEYVLLLWSAVLWGVSGGWSAIWFFQGTQRLREAGMLDITAKSVSAVGVFWFVQGPHDAWKVIALQGAMSACANVAATYLAYRYAPFARPSRRQMVTALGDGWAMFLFKSSAMAMLSSNAFILALVAPLQRVGYYAAAEKISRAFWQLLWPMNQVLYPRLSRLARTHGEQSRVAAVGFTAMTGFVGLGLGVLLYAAAPLLLRVLMGKAFMPALPVLHIVAMLGPIVAINSALAFYWLFPAGLEATYTRLVIAAFTLSGILNATLAYHLAEIGTALSVVCAELVMLGGAVWLLRDRLRLTVMFPATVALAMSETVDD